MAASVSLNSSTFAPLFNALTCWLSNHRPDIGDFLKDSIKGPATFTCTTGTDGGCKFEEPAMNGLILSIFGDGYISLRCKGGECLHYSQVPGYVVSIRFSAQVFFLVWFSL